MSTTFSLNQLGWQSFYQQQLSLNEFESSTPARIVEHHRSEYVLQTEQSQIKLNITSSLPPMTVGDWLLLSEDHQFERLLERKSKISRKASGSKLKEQLIAANIDTLFIVSSFNHDFNLSRFERYLAIAHEAEVEPVIVLTKQDLCDGQQAHYLTQLQELDPYLLVESVNSTDHESVNALSAWCKPGKTISFIGSSGVGKSTLVNTLMSSAHTAERLQATGAIREDDSKGRHTTTSRSLHFMPSGSVLIDTPGMRELQLAACESGVSQTFADVEQLANACRFSDCQHQTEPGCAVRAALESGELEQRRFDNYIKLMREQARNSASLQQQRAQDKALGKMYRRVMGETQKIKKAGKLD
ncbi:MAG: ribosome small subunit-dependent GTPase A [Gammaproteobacteria bacterium]|nr:ribosome small subunit-dependent GTPase A [Gammaproteobacteria bacterium]